MNTQYYILIGHPNLYSILAWIQDNDIPHEIHANRIRFRPHTERLALEFALQYMDSCSSVEHPYPTVF